MPRESRLRSKLPTHDDGEKGHTDITLARRQYRFRFAALHISSVRISRGASMSHKFLPSLLLVCALFAGPALAQTSAAPVAVAPAPNNANALTPDQAKRALDTLQDDNKRAQIIETLRAIANAAPQAAAPAPEAKPAIPLTADSLGAQLLLTVSDQVGEVSHEVAHLVR